MSRRIYLASSWRNKSQPTVLSALRSHGYEVYDFRNPAPGNTGFRWHEVREDYVNWTLDRFISDLYTSEVTKAGFELDLNAMRWCDTCVCLLPCGRSAHLEAGWCIGQGKPTVFCLDKNTFEPELMYMLGHCVATYEDLFKWLRELRA